jgi:hypothetical protein
MNYYSFILQPRKNLTSQYEQSQTLEFIDTLRNILSKNVYSIKPIHYHSNIIFIFIPKDKLKTNTATIENFLSLGVTSGKILPLPDYLYNPLDFHTSYYSHALDSITLGDPGREYKRQKQSNDNY